MFLNRRSGPNSSSSRQSARNRARRRAFLANPEQLEGRLVMATLMVSNLNGLDVFSAGDGSLRGEIAAANPGDTIEFSPNLAGGTITLAGADVPINKSLTIDRAHRGLRVARFDHQRI